MSPLADRLTDLTARFWRLEPEEVAGSLRFDSRGLSGFGSVRVLTFFAAIESQLGVRIDDPSSIRTFADLLTQVENGGPPAPAPDRVAAPVPAPVPRIPASIGLGHDIEEVRNLPDAADYRQDPFYRDNFSPAELDYCLDQQDPRPHLAARWCAKEAVKKCSPHLLHVPMASIEVSLLVTGEPTVQILDEAARRSLHDARLLVSLSHTDSFASAVAVLLPA